MKEMLTFGNTVPNQEEKEMTKESLEQKEKEIKTLLESKNPYGALQIIRDIEKSSKESEHHQWCERKQRLITAYGYKNQDKKLIKTVLAETKNKESQEGRIKKFELTFGEAYDGPRAEKNTIEFPKSESDFIKNALAEGKLEKAKKLIEEFEMKIKNGEIKSEEGDFPLLEKLGHRKKELAKAYHEYQQLHEAFKSLSELRTKVENNKDKKSEDFHNLCRNLDHKERELFQAFIAIKDWEGAQEVIDAMIETPHNEKHNSKKGRQTKLVKEISENTKEKSDNSNPQGDEE